MSSKRGSTPRQDDASPWPMRLRLRLGEEEGRALQRLRQADESDTDTIRRLIRERDGEQFVVEALARMESRLARLESSGLQAEAGTGVPAVEVRTPRQELDAELLGWLAENDD